MLVTGQCSLSGCFNDPTETNKHQSWLNQPFLVDSCMSSLHSHLSHYFWHSGVKMSHVGAPTLVQGMKLFGHILWAIVRHKGVRYAMSGIKTLIADLEEVSLSQFISMKLE